MAMCAGFSHSRPTLNNQADQRYRWA